MAHFAQLNSDKIVTTVVVVDNANLLDESGTEQESLGSAYLEQHLGPGPWVQTSYNNNPIAGLSRGKYAGLGDFWDGSTFQTL